MGGLVGNLVFLSKGVQIALFVLLLCLLLLFMKVSTLESRLGIVEYDLGNYVSTEDYMETLNNALDEIRYESGAGRPAARA